MSRLQLSRADARSAAGRAGCCRSGFSLTLAAVLLAAAALESAFAAEDDLSKRIAACTREQDDTRRLACFDRAAAPKAAAERVDADQVDATQTFGVQGSELARSRGDSDTQQESAPKRVTAKVTGLDKRPRGELVFTLDNGQVWAQKEAGAYFPIKVGDPVTILAGTLGSFRLVVGNRATAVTRVR
jgi:hypothetical protein